jgi:hypothetical protein
MHHDPFGRMIEIPAILEEHFVTTSTAELSTTRRISPDPHSGEIRT